MHIKLLFHHFVSAHPLTVGYAALGLLFVFLALIACESFRRDKHEREIRKLNRICPSCSEQPVAQKHFKIPLEPDPKYPWISRWDWLCQTKARCGNQHCFRAANQTIISKDGWYVVKTYVKHFDPIRRWTHPGEFRQGSPSSEFTGPMAKYLLGKRQRKVHRQIPVFGKPELKVPPPPEIENFRFHRPS